MSDGCNPSDKIISTPYQTIGAADLLQMSHHHYGFLRKWGTVEQMLKSFKFRWRQWFVVLSQGCVYCYKNEMALKPTKAFSLKFYQRVLRYLPEDQNIQNCFQIIGDDATKPHIFACESEEKRIEWMRKIQEMMKLAHGLKLPETTMESASPVRPDSSQVYTDVERKMSEIKMDGRPLPRAPQPDPPIQKVHPLRTGKTSSIVGGGFNRRTVSLDTYEDVATSKPTSLKQKTSGASEYDLEEEEEDDEGGKHDYDEPDEVEELRQKNENLERMKKSGLIKPAVGPKPTVGLKKSKSESNGSSTVPGYNNIEAQTSYYNFDPREYIFPESDRDRALSFLSGKPAGTFLVRNSRQGDAKVLSFQSETSVPKEIKIIKKEDQWSLDNRKCFKSLELLIDNYKDENIPSHTIPLKNGYLCKL